MALSRLALKNLQYRLLVSPSPSLVSKTQILNYASTGIRNFQKQKWSFELPKRMLSTRATDEKSEIAVSQGDKKSKLFPRRNSDRGGLLRNNLNLVPSLSGLGNALMQATHNINKLFENLSPSRLIGRVKEKEDHYKLRYEVPGLAKEDVKIRVEDGVLRIIGEAKNEEEEESDDDCWSSLSYGYYDSALVLPMDAKVDEIKAELKDGVLYITIPRIEKVKKDMKEVQVL
ncbi:hypothetical protein LguiB_008227 [Lonicera macranthoides]